MASRHSRPPRECIQVMLWSVSILSATNSYVSRPTFPTSAVFLNRHICIEASLLQPLHSLFFFPIQQNLCCNKKPEITWNPIPFPTKPRKQKNFPNRAGWRRLAEPRLGAAAGLRSAHSFRLPAAIGRNYHCCKVSYSCALLYLFYKLIQVFFTHTKVNKSWCYFLLTIWLKSDSFSLIFILFWAFIFVYEVFN